MRHLATFASFAVIALCALAAMKVRLPWLHCSYFMAQMCFGLCGWLALQRLVLESRAYLYLFGIFFGLVLILALLVALSFPLSREGLLKVAWLGVGILVAVVLTNQFLRPAALRLVVMQSGVLLFCGAVTRLALSGPLTPEMRYTATALSAFWFLQGLHGWAYAGSRGTWEAGNWFVPQMLAIACFGWLAWSLNGLQSERVFEPLPEIHVAHSPLVEEAR